MDSSYAITTPGSVSIGNNGGSLFAGIFGIHPNPELHLFDSSAYVDNDNFAMPQWSLSQSFHNQVKFFAVDSADNADVHVEFRKKRSIQGNDNSPLVSEVRKFSSASSIVDWEYVFPGITTDSNQGGGVLVSDDGLIVAAYSYNSQTARTEVMVFNGYTGVPNQQQPIILHMSGQVKSAALSGDGSTLALISNSQWRIIDTATGAETIGHNIGAPITGGIALDYYGNRMATTHFGSPNGYLKVYSTPFTGANIVEIPLPGNLQFAQTNEGIALSDTGNYVAWGYIYPGVSASDKGGILLHDINSPSNPQTKIHYQFDGLGGSLTNGIPHIEFAENDNIFIAGLWGDEYHTTPEIIVFDKEQNDPIIELWTYNSINDLDVADDGSHIGVTIKNAHATTGHSPYELARFNLV